MFWQTSEIYTDAFCLLIFSRPTHFSSVLHLLHILDLFPSFSCPCPPSSSIPFSFPSTPTIHYHLANALLAHSRIYLFCFFRSTHINLIRARASTFRHSATLSRRLVSSGIQSGTILASIFKGLKTYLKSHALSFFFSFLFFLFCFVSICFGWFDRFFLPSNRTTTTN